MALLFLIYIYIYISISHIVYIIIYLILLAMALSFGNIVALLSARYLPSGTAKTCREVGWQNGIGRDAAAGALQ